MAIGVSQVRDAVERWADSGRLAADHRRKLPEFIDYVYGQVRDDDVFDVNLNTEWRNFMDGNSGHWYTR